ncbi:MAG: sulfatase [Tepidisphaeraceae bacterium]
MRRLFIVTVCTVLFATFAPAQTTRPNVLFIAIDDLNDWVGPLGGHPQVKTPNFDRLARRGTTFTNAHCQSPLCNPSRASLLTSLRPSTTGVYALEPWFRESPALKDHVTLPQHFMKCGYRTLTTGKIYHDAYPPEADRESGKEFTVWGFHGGYGPYPPKRLVETPVSKSRVVDWGVFPETDEQQLDWKVADWAIEQLRSAPKDSPTMLSVGFRRPHMPIFASQKWFDLYPDDDTLVMPPVKLDDRDDLPRFASYLHWRLPEARLLWLKEHNQWRNIVRSYLASVSFMDSQLGRVLDALDASGLSDCTIIVLWSDHGWHLGEKGMTGKTTLWERSTRVPLIFAGPGIATNTKCASPVELLDVYPTLAALCDLPPAPRVEGQSLVAQLKDATAAREQPAITSHGPGSHAVRDARWRYIRYADGSEELYDHEADPNEWTNLATDAKHAAEKTRLARWLPKADAPGLPGSKSRYVELRDGKVYWQGTEIDQNAPFQ